MLLIALVAYAIAYEKNSPGSWTRGHKSLESNRKLGDYSSGYDSSLHDEVGHSGGHFNAGVYGAESPGTGIHKTASHDSTGYNTGAHYAGAQGTTGYNTGAHYAGAQGTTSYNTGAYKAGLHTGYENSANKYGHHRSGLHNTAYDSKLHDTGAYNPKPHGTAYGAHPSIKEHIPFSNQKSEYTYK